MKRAVEFVDVIYTGLPAFTFAQYSQAIGGRPRNFRCHAWKYVESIIFLYRELVIHRKELPLPFVKPASRVLPTIAEPEVINNPHTDERIKQLEQQAAKWHQCNIVRAYLKAVEAAAIKKFGKIEKGSSIDQWLSFGYDYANSLDPTAKVVDWFELDSNPVVRNVKK